MKVAYLTKRFGMALLLLITVATALHIPAGSSQGSSVGRMLVPDGSPAPNFFDGLPVDARFSNGRNPFAEAAAPPACGRDQQTAPLLEQIRHFLGLSATVQAQATCVGCYKNEYFAGSCGQGCNSNSLWAIGVSGPCATGDVYIGLVACGA